MTNLVALGSIVGGRKPTSKIRSGALAIALLTTASAQAANISSLALNKGGVAILIDGPITSGDAAKFRLERIKASQAITMVGLNSLGGEIPEAVEIAELMKGMDVTAVVIDKAICASACFLLFAAASQRFVSEGALVGVHNASVEGNQNAGADATIKVAQYAKTLGVPDAILGRMAITSSNDVAWLTFGELRSMGTEVASIEKPSAAQAQTAKQQPASAPQSYAAAKFVPPTANVSRADKWVSFTKWGAKLSAQQNGGTQQLSRSNYTDGGYRVTLTWIDAKGRRVEAWEDHAPDGEARSNVWCVYQPDNPNLRTCADFGEQEINYYKATNGRWYRSS